MVVARRQRGFALTTSLSVVTAAGGFVVVAVNGLLYALRVGNADDDYNRLDNAATAVGSLFTTCASLNLSLMWVEFSLATERLQSISNNLKLTRTALLGEAQRGRDATR